MSYSDISQAFDALKLAIINSIQENYERTIYLEEELKKERKKRRKIAEILLEDNNDEY